MNRTPPPAAPASGPMGRGGRTLWPAVLGVALAGGAAYLIASRYYRGPSTPAPPPPPDPRVVYGGPFLNVRPDVAFVPDARCAECHAEIAESYSRHPMGRSLAPASASRTPPEDSAHHDPFDALGVRFSAGHEGDVAWHRATLPGPGGPAAELAWRVDYVLGSGTRGYSYLTDRGGYLFQTPVSWFSQKQIWDVSPGFNPTLRTGRMVLAGCLYCHANRARHVEGSVNHYEEPVFDGHAIGCQRCHGPGAVHVEAPGRRGESPPGADLTIVNPRRLAPGLRDAVCEQCHLLGENRVARRGRDPLDFRPGLAAADFWSVFVRNEAEKGPGAVGHVEGMYRSRCFTAGSGSGRLGCVSCHDPHRTVPAAERVSHYRAACLTCHKEKSCSLPKPERLRHSREDSCVDCHMPRYDAPDIAHTASTDHSIPRGGKPRVPGKSMADAGGVPVVAFYPGRTGAEAEEDARDLAVTLVRMARHGETDPRSAGPALPTLEGAARRAPDDLVAREELGFAYGLQGRWREAAPVFASVLAEAPGREVALMGAAAAAEAERRPEEAAGFWGRAAAASPYRADYRRDLARLLVKAQHWAEAAPHCDAWVRLDPFNPEARVARIQCLLASGDKETARAEFSRLEALAPDNLVELRARFRRKLQ